jgi:hypothetical protein
MRKYWTCTKFADWIRGTAKPNAATSQGWYDWRKEAKAKHPYRFWLTETAMHQVQRLVDYIPDRLADVRYYINNRWITRTHALTAHPRDIPRGEWRDVGNRFLPCLFNELVDFVEVELAWSHVMWDADAREKYKTPWWRSGWLRWRTWRCPEAGVANLEWASNLKFDDQWLKPTDPSYGKPTPQAEGSQEILTLYKWWTEVYLKRPDPMEASGVKAIYERERAEDDEDDIFISINRKRTKEQQEEYNRAHEIQTAMEAEYEREEEEMMIRLIKIRQSLWT